MCVSVCLCCDAMQCDVLPHSAARELAQHRFGFGELLEGREGKGRVEGRGCLVAMIPRALRGWDG